MDHRYEDVSDCEVDHSFFDSDFEEEVKEVGTRAKTDAKGTCEFAQTEDAIERNTDMKMESKVLELDSSQGKTQQEDTGFPDGHVFSSCACQPDDATLPSLNSESVNTSGSDSAQGAVTHGNNITSQVPQIVKHCEENYYTDEEDSSDDSRNQLVRHRLSKQSNSAKVSKNTAVHLSSSSSSSSSSSCSSDTDCSDTDSDGCLLDSSYCSSKKKSLGSLAVHSPKQKPSPGTKLVEVKPKLNDGAEDSEDTVTDVTPLSTPDISPIQSFELSASSDKKLKVTRQENVSQEVYEPDLDHKCQQKVLHEAMDLNHLLKAFLQLEKKEQQKLVLDQSPISSRKNYSFTNEEVRQIDRENQRLLKELTKHSTKPRSKSASLKKPSGPPPKMYHSAINRQREQQRIDRENLAFLKRLEAVKPSAGMRRSEQLMDYQRQMSYLNAAPTPRRGKSALSHHSPSRGASRASSHSASSSASRRSERPVFDSSSSALQRLNPSNIRGAWL